MEVVIALLIVGTLLMLAETVLPGMIAGIIGFFCLVAAVVAAYVKFGAREGNMVLTGVVLLLIVGTLAWIKYFPESPMARRFVSKRTIADPEQRSDLLHQRGTAFTQLHPCGTAVINGKRVDVVTEGSLVERGASVEVIAVEGMRIVVRSVS